MNELADWFIVIALIALLVGSHIASLILRHNAAVSIRRARRDKGSAPHSAQHSAPRPKDPGQDHI